MNNKKLILGLGFVLLIVLFFVFDLQAVFNLENFQARRETLIAFRDENFVVSCIVYFVLYVAVAALSLPVAAIVTVAGGAIFGFWWALVLVSFASTIGATLGFLVVRTLLRDWVQARFGKRLKRINRGVEKDGRFYLFSIRMVPIFPFFVINAVMALTPIRVRDFYLMSQLGMLFGTAVYVNVGAQLGQATSLPDVFSFDMIFAMVLLAVFPWLARALLNFIAQRKVARGFPRPKRFDTNLVVIGAGSAGLVTSYIAALTKARVILIEENRMGGDCLNTGCVPSKALIRAAGINHLIRRAGEFGLRGASAEVDFSGVMQRIRDTIAKIEPHDSAERYTALGVECINGRATIKSPYTVEVNGREITTRNIVLATGAQPLVPDIPGLADVQYVTSDTVWDLQELPRRLLVAGGGVIGCELAQAFARLGSAVTVLDQAERLLPGEDEDVSQALAEQFGREGIVFLGGRKIASFEAGAGGGVVIADNGGEEERIEFDVVLLALGRKANTKGYGLENLDMTLEETGTIAVNQYLQTRYPNIYACGDIIGPYQFTHMAAFQAWFASINSLLAPLWQFKVDYSIVPRATFSDPEVARVGLNEREAAEQEVDFEVTRYGIDDLDRAIVEGENRGFIKVLTPPGGDRILGVTIVGSHAAELIAEFVLAMKHNLGLKKIMATIHIYPTLAESNKYVAGQWRQKHQPEWLWPWLEKFHRWRRG